jgi:hypothetical protein
MGCGRGAACGQCTGSVNMRFTEPTSLPSFNTKLRRSRSDAMQNRIKMSPLIIYRASILEADVRACTTCALIKRNSH